jgi:hypothetical protein
MAKIHEETVVITLSKLVKDSDTGTEIASDDIVTALQSVTEELLGRRHCCGSCESITCL